MEIYSSELPPGFLAISCRRNALQTAIAAGTERTAGQIRTICAGPHKPMVCSSGKAPKKGLYSFRSALDHLQEVAVLLPSSAVRWNGKVPAQSHLWANRTIITRPIFMQQRRPRPLWVCLDSPVNHSLEAQLVLPIRECCLPRGKKQIAI